MCQHSTNTWPGCRVCTSIKHTAVTLALQLHPQWQQQVLTTTSKAAAHYSSAWLLHASRWPFTTTARTAADAASADTHQSGGRPLLGCEEHGPERHSHGPERADEVSSCNTLPARQPHSLHSLTLTLCEASCAHSTPSHSTNAQRIPPHQCNLHVLWCRPEGAHTHTKRRSSQKSSVHRLQHHQWAVTAESFTAPCFLSSCKRQSCHPAARLRKVGVSQARACCRCCSCCCSSQ